MTGSTCISLHHGGEISPADSGLRKFLREDDVAEEFVFDGENRYRMGHREQSAQGCLLPGGRPNLLAKRFETAFVGLGLAFGGEIARSRIEKMEESDRIDRSELLLQCRQPPAVEFDGRGCGLDFGAHAFKDSGNSVDWQRGL